MATISTTARPAYVYDAGGDQWVPIAWTVLGSGAASAPALTFTGDSNTGLWSPGADTLAASTGGTERMRIDNDGLITGTGTSLGAWTSYTPTLTASTTNPTLGTGSTATGAYCRIGKLVFYRAAITFGTSGVNAGSGFYFVSLPVTSASITGFTPISSVFLEDVSTATRYLGSALWENSTTVSLQTTGNGVVTSANPMTWAASDIIRISGVYEVA